MSLKRESQRKLHITRIVRAGNLAETCGGAVRPASPDRRVKVRVIEEIKYIQAELQPDVFAQREFLLKCGIEIVEAGPGYDVAARVAVGERGRHREAGYIEPLRRCFWTAIGIANQIRPL